ncbi:MAG: pelota family protein [Poseidonia sp.]
MNILKRDLHEWRLRVETLDDLWVLARLARRGVSVAMLGERRDQTTAGEEGGRSKQAERKKMWIQLSVQTTEHQSFSDTLRIHGIIEEAPIDIGMHHTHMVELRDDLVLSNTKGFSEMDVQLLKESESASKQGQVALLVVEGDEIILYFITARGLRESATWTMRGGGKRGDLRQHERVASQFRQTIVDGLTQQLDEMMPLVLCGPGRNRDRMLEDLRGAGHRRPMLSVATSMGGRGAANEVLRDGLAGELLAQHRMVQEVTLLEEAWVRISTNGAVAYGGEAIKKAVQEGAVERLLILADLLRDDTSTCDGSPWSDLVEQITSFGGEIIQCSADHDAGEQLVGFGGAVALLRYSV